MQRNAISYEQQAQEDFPQWQTLLCITTNERTDTAKYIVGNGVKSVILSAWESWMERNDYNPDILNTHEYDRIAMMLAGYLKYLRVSYADDQADDRDRQEADRAYRMDRPTAFQASFL